jgi:hypothetical protein
MRRGRLRSGRSSGRRPNGTWSRSDIGVLELASAPVEARPPIEGPVCRLYDALHSDPRRGSMTEYRLISSNSHVRLPVEKWLEYLSPNRSPS